MSNKAKVNPSSPIIHLTIGDTTITTANSPRQAQNIVSFSLTESALDTYNDIVFTLFDDTALLLEYELKRGYSSVYYRFGMDETSICSERVCHIVDYDLEFESGGAVLTLSCLNGPGLHSENDDASKEYEGKISDVVRQICSDLGYKEGNIVETNDSPPETPYTNSGKDLLSFIKQDLVPKATSTDGESGYVCYTKDSDGEMYLYFEPIKIASVDQYEIYEFTIGKEHENIISFKPEYKGLLQYVVGQGSSTTSNSSDSSTIDNNSDTSNGASDDATSTYKLTRDILIEDSAGGSTSTPSESPMKGLKVYSKNTSTNIYSGTNSKTCQSLATISGDQWFLVESETPAWYYGQNEQGTWGYIRKVDTSIYPSRLLDNNTTNDFDTTTGSTSTDSTTYATSTNTSSNAEIMNQLGLHAPSVDELSNVLITPYSSDSDFKRWVGSSSYNAEELGRIAEYMFTMASALQPTAQLQLRGNALVDTQSFVLLVVMTKDKLFHHSSGLYQILEVQHNIDLGDFTTTLNLIKRAMSIDDSGNITLLDVSEGVLAPSTISGTSSTTTSGTTISGGASSSVIKQYCDKYIGLPYVWGGSGPNKSGYDCSGFVSEVLYDMGYERIGTTVDFMGINETVPWDKSQIQPGDCMVYRANGKGHVVMIVDENTIAHSPKKGDVIKYADIEYHWNYIQQMGGKIVRVLGNDKYKRSDS